MTILRKQKNVEAEMMKKMRREEQKARRENKFWE